MKLIKDKKDLLAQIKVSLLQLQTMCRNIVVHEEKEKGITSTPKDTSYQIYHLNEPEYEELDGINYIKHYYSGLERNYFILALKIIDNLHPKLKQLEDAPELKVKGTEEALRQFQYFMSKSCKHIAIKEDVEDECKNANNGFFLIKSCLIRSTARRFLCRSL